MLDELKGLLFAENEDKMQRVVNLFDTECDIIKLKVIAGKSKVMVLKELSFTG